MDSMTAQESPTESHEGASERSDWDTGGHAPYAYVRLMSTPLARPPRVAHVISTRAGVGGADRTLADLVTHRSAPPRGDLGTQSICPEPSRPTDTRLLRTGCV
jgi:hypothetical protein